MKPHVTFKLDYKKDARNYFDAANSRMYDGWDFSKFVLPEIKKRVRGKSWEKSKTYLYGLMKENYTRDGKMINLIKKQFSEAWGLVEGKYFKRLENVMKKPIYTNNFTAYLTTCKRCPYDEKENSFMTNMWESSISAILTSAHEISHLQFHKYYWNQCEKELGSWKKTNDLKEALTVLLNKKFKDLILAEDKGYPAHHKLREHIAKLWDKTKDFDKVLEGGIKYLKK